MKEYYYCLDGQTVDGPHSEGEMKELLAAGTLPSETLVCSAGEKDWMPISTIKFSTAEIADPKKSVIEPPPPDAATSLDHKAIVSAGSDKDEETTDKEKEKEKAKDKELGKYQLITALRSDLDMLWKAQRESLISQIRGLELDSTYETTRKQAKLIKERVKETALAYWHKTKAYDEWIQELVWKHGEGDIQRKLRGQGCEEKYEDAKGWLADAKLIDEAGCYCFKVGKEYIYIGKAGGGESNLGRRLHDHRKSVYFERATHLRIIIPGHKSWISKLERLLLLSYPNSQYNDGTPNKGNNPADNMLDMLDREINDLLTDA